jgi:hypothetical protein
VVPHGEAAAKEWTSLKAQRVEGWRWNGCLVALLNGSELKFTCCVLALEGQVERVSWEEMEKSNDYDVTCGRYTGDVSFEDGESLRSDTVRWSMRWSVNWQRLRGWTVWKTERAD